MATQWYYKIDDEKHGPVSSQQLKKLAMAGKLSPSDPVRRTTDRRWVFASKVHGLFDEPVETEQVEEPEEPVEEEDDYPQGNIPMGRAVDPAEYQDDEDEGDVEEDSYEDEEEEEIPAPKSKKRSKSGGFDMSFASESAGAKNSDSVSFDFGGSSGHSSRGSYRSYGKKSKSAGKAAKTKPAAAKPRKPKPEENLDPEEKAKRLSKKEQSKKRFMIITSVVAGVIVLALVVYFVMKSKPEKQEYRSPKEIAANAAAQESAKDAASKANADAANADAANAEAGTEAETTTTSGGMFSADGPSGLVQAGGDGAAANPSSGDAKAGDAGGSEFAPGKGNYTDASANEIKRGAVQLRIVEAVQGSLNDYAHVTSESEEKLLFVKIKITNKSEDNKNLNYPGWGTRRLYSDVNIQDNFGNTYKLKTKLGARIPDRVLAAKQITDDAFDILVFDAPRKNTEYLLLDLPSFIPGETEPYKFKIPGSMLNAKVETEEVPIGDDPVLEGPAKEGDKKEEAKEGDKKAAPNEEGETIDLDEGDDANKGEAPASAAPVTEKPADNAEAKPEEKAEEAKPAEGDAKEEKAEEGEKMAPADEEFAEDPEAKAKVAAQDKAVADLSKVDMDTFNRRQLSELARKKIIKINRKDKAIEVLNEKELLKYMQKNKIDVPMSEPAQPAAADQPAEAGGKERPLSEAELEEKEAREAAEADFGELMEDGDGDAGGEIKEAGAMKELSKQADRENDAAAREAMKGGRKNNRR